MPTRRPRPSRARRSPAVLAAIALVAGLGPSDLAAARPPDGRRVLVQPGADLAELARGLGPGDALLLMPGRHQPARLEDLTGAPGSPVEIRPARPGDPPVVVGGEIGLELVRARHVVVRDLVLEGQRDAAVRLVGAGDGERDDDLRLIGLRIRDLDRSPGVEPDGVELIGVRGVRLERIVLSGWRGAALAMANARGVDVVGCDLDGLAEADRRGDVPTGACGVRLAGDCDGIRLEGCVLHGAGTVAGIRGLAGHEPGSSPGLELEGCAIVDQVCPLLLEGRWRARMVQCSIVRPHRWVLAAIGEPGDGRPVLDVDRCLFAWRSGDLTGIVRVLSREMLGSIRIGENLWWSGEPIERRAGMLPGRDAVPLPQVLDVDPSLDERLRPRAKAATIFGWPDRWARRRPIEAEMEWSDPKRCPQP